MFIKKQNKNQHIIWLNFNNFNKCGTYFSIILEFE